MAETYAEAVEEARAAPGDLVLVERAGEHAVVTLNDPDKLNPLSAALTVRLREALPRHVSSMMKPLLRGAADMTWDQAIALEEFAEPGCFTTEAHRAGVAQLLA